MPQAANAIVGAVFREIREDLGLSAETVASRLGVCGANAVTGWERGDRALMLDRFYALCAVYQTDPRHVLSVIEKRGQLATAS